MLAVKLPDVGFETTTFTFGVYNLFSGPIGSTLLVCMRVPSTLYHIDHVGFESGFETTTLTFGVFNLFSGPIGSTLVACGVVCMSRQLG